MLIPEWGGLALRRPQFGSPCALSISDVNAGVPEQLLDERDAFGLRAGPNGSPEQWPQSVAHKEDCCG